MMKKSNFLKTLVVLMSVSSTSVYAGFLTKEEIDEAEKLGTSTIKYNSYSSNEKDPIDEKDAKDKKDAPWLTLEKFYFKNTKRKTTSPLEDTIFLVGNSISENGFGEIALYHGYTDPKKINLTTPGRFNDIIGERYLSTLCYEHRPKENDIFVHSFETDQEREPHVNEYHQACLEYFLNEFVSKRTDVTHVTTNSGRGIPETHYQYMSPFMKGEDGNLHWNK